MFKTRSGFTIVELLIVIVVIAILAAITIVAYNGIQQRARDSARSSAVENIQKALESYRAINGVYPPVAPGTTSATAPAGFSGVWQMSGGYSYSVDTAGNWLVNLTKATSAGAPLLSKVPVDPTNDNQHYFAYYSSAAGLGACQEPFYILTVQGYESSGDIPSSSHDVNCTSGGTTAHWTLASNRGVFSNIQGQ